MREDTVQPVIEPAGGALAVGVEIQSVGLTARELESDLLYNSADHAAS